MYVHMYHIFHITALCKNRGSRLLVRGSTREGLSRAMTPKTTLRLVGLTELSYEMRCNSLEVLVSKVRPRAVPGSRYTYLKEVLSMYLLE
jgi:hypothetical protein